MECKFCEDIHFLNQLHADEEKADKKINHQYSVSLVSKKSRGKTLLGAYTFAGYKLNYCPECGKNISYGERKVDADDK